MTSPSSVASWLSRGRYVDRLRSLVFAGFAAVCVFEAMRRGALFGEKLAAAIVVVCLIVACAWRPYIAAIGIVVWVPLQVAVLSYLFHLGAPLQAVRYLGYLKEFWAIALLLALFVAPTQMRSRRRFDVLDWVALGYIAVATAYLLIPIVARGSLGGQSFSIRLNAWRVEALYVVLFFCIRQLRFPDPWIRRTRNAVLVVAVIIAGFAIWESVNRAGFNHFQIYTLGLENYSVAVLHVTGANNQLLTSETLAGTPLVRDGSLFNSAYTLAFFMLIPFGIGLERLAARRLSGLVLAGSAAAAVGILLAVTRSAALGATIAAILAVSIGSRQAPGRLRLVVVLATAVVVLLPSLSHSTLKTRFADAFSAKRDSESQSHITAIKNGLNYLVHDPVGRGLGENTGTGNRFGTGIQATTEDSYLETGLEIGLAAMVLQITLLLLLLSRLRARSRLDGLGAEMAGAMWLGGAAIAVGAVFIQAWFDITTALVFWTFAGLALQVKEDAAERSGSRRVALLNGVVARA